MPKFAIGNKEAEKWTFEEVEKIMFQMLENAKTNKDILCLQDAIFSVNLYSSSLNYLLEIHPVFESIKKDIQDIIVARVNSGALKGDFVSTPAIWRMKQCGEKDESAINHQNNGGAFEQPLKMSEELIEKLIDKL